MADNNRTFRELLTQQKETNQKLEQLSQDNKVNKKLLSDIENETTAEIVAASRPEVETDTRNVIGQTAITKAEFDQQQDIFRTLNDNIRAMGRVVEKGVQQDAEFYADEDRDEERLKALRESRGEDPLPSDESFGKDLKEGVGGVFGALRGIFFGTAGIFAAIFAFVAALGNEKFREVVFKATDAVKKAFVDFGELIEGDKGLLEFLKENALTIASVTALLMPVKTFGLLKTAALGLPKALTFLGAGLKTISTFFSTTILPIFGPIIRVMGSVIAVLFGIKKGVEDGLAYFKETSNVLDSINFAIASFLGFMISLPAKIFTTVIDGALGLLEFFTFGWLNFDEIQEEIRNMDFAGYMRDAIFDFFQVAQEFIQEKVLNAGTFILDLGIQLGGYAKELSDSVVSFAKGIRNKIYDPETGTFLGMTLPELPTLGDMFDKLKELKNKIYNPETGAIFGFIPGEVFNFKLPNIGDLFMNLIGSILPDPSSFIGKGLYALPGTDILEQAAKSFSEGGKIVDGVMTIPNSTTTLDDTQLDAMEAKKQYEMLMRKMEENEKLTDEQKSFINQYNIMNGGNSVSQSSSTGFSTKKSAFNDDYTSQMLAGSMP